MLPLILISLLFPIQQDATTNSTADDPKNSIDGTEIVVVLGAAGTDELGKEFQTWQSKIENACKANKIPLSVVAQKPAKGNQKSELVQTLKDRSSGASPLWIILIGHGSYDGKIAKFNLVGPDISSDELVAALDLVQRPTAVVNCFSSSAPFINSLSKENRIVVSATKSGFELNYSRFGKFFADALFDKAADIDKDDQTSLLEAFLFASRQTQEFYETEGRLSTEHALIDDNGDKTGTPFDWFGGVRVVKVAKDKKVPDGPLGNQWHLVKSEFEKKLSNENRNRRNQLELEIERLRLQKKDLSGDVYYAKLEPIALELAKLYDELEPKTGATSTDSKMAEPSKKTPSKGTTSKAVTSNGSNTEADSPQPPNPEPNRSTVNKSN